MRGLIFQFCALVVSTSGLYLFSFGISGPVCSHATPCMYTISGLSFARHSHRVVLHVQLRPIHTAGCQAKPWVGIGRGGGVITRWAAEENMVLVTWQRFWCSTTFRRGGLEVMQNSTLARSRAHPTNCEPGLFIIISSWLELLEFPSMSATSSWCSASAPSCGRLPTRLPTWLDPTPLKP